MDSIYNMYTIKYQITLNKKMERLNETLDEGALDLGLGTKRSQKAEKKKGEPKPLEKFGILGMRENGHQKNSSAPN